MSKYKTALAKNTDSSFNFTDIYLKGLKLGEDSRRNQEHCLELSDHSMLFLGTNISKQVSNDEQASYIDNSKPEDISRAISTEEKPAEYPRITSVGRSDFIGGASISTEYNDLRIGLYDKLSFENSNITSSEKRADQAGSAIIRSKGTEPTTGDIHSKTGLEVYHGMRITDFGTGSGKNNAFNDTEDKYDSTTLSTSAFQSTNFTNFKDSTKLDNFYELSYVRDSDGTKYQKSLADNIYLHSDTTTSISNHTKKLIKMDSAGIVIKNDESEIKLNNTDIEVKGNQFYVEEELCIGPKNSVNYRLKIDGEKLIITKYDGVHNKGKATIIDVAETYTPPANNSRLATYLTGIHHGDESSSTYQSH